MTIVLRPKPLKRAPARPRPRRPRPISTEEGHLRHPASVMSGLLVKFPSLDLAWPEPIRAAW